MSSLTMATARSAINTWIGTTCAAVNNKPVAYQLSESHSPDSWRVHWLKETKGDVDQGRSRLVQLDRFRNDGDEVSMEADCAAWLTAAGLDGLNAQVVVSGMRVGLQNGDGWEPLPPLDGDPQRLRYSLTLEIQRA